MTIEKCDETHQKSLTLPLRDQSPWRVGSYPLGPPHSGPDGASLFHISTNSSPSSSISILFGCFEGGGADSVGDGCSVDKGFGGGEEVSWGMFRVVGVEVERLVRVRRKEGRIGVERKRTEAARIRDILDQ